MRTYHVCCIQRSHQNCSPSFVDSILQAYVMAPFFVLLEVHTWFPISLFLASWVRWEVVWYCDTRRRSLKFNPCIKLEEAFLPHGGSHFLIPSVVSFWSRKSLLKPFALSTYPLVGCNKWLLTARHRVVLLNNKDNWQEVLYGVCFAGFTHAWVHRFPNRSAWWTTSWTIVKKTTKRYKTMQPKRRVSHSPGTWHHRPLSPAPKYHRPMFNNFLLPQFLQSVTNFQAMYDLQLLICALCWLAELLVMQWFVFWFWCWILLLFPMLLPPPLHLLRTMTTDCQKTIKDKKGWERIHIWHRNISSMVAAWRGEDLTYTPED